MAVSRYDQRKNCEAQESNTIGTEYLRVGLLPDADTIKVRALLKQYLDLRVQFYRTWDKQQLQQIKTRTDQVQNELWVGVKTPSLAQPNPITALVISGMNSVLDAQGYTQAAWWNRIPTAAWGLMVWIAGLCNLLVGFRAPRSSTILLLILPLAVALAFFLIADIDSPVGGRIRVHPQNLESLYKSMR
jgi:lipopolysaccharide export LptBFGC system permease protein LptF